MARRIALIIVISVFISSLIGCHAVSAPETNINLNLNTYADVHLPTPLKVVLSKPSDVSEQQNITIKQEDVGPLLRILRSAVDTKLTTFNVTNDAWQKNQRFGLELSYQQPSQLVLMIGNSLTKFKASKILIGLDQKVLLIASDQGLTALSGVKLSDQFITFMQEFSVDSGFPLSPTSSGNKVEQIPLAEPGQDQIDFLPPAKPDVNPGH